MGRPHTQAAKEKIRAAALARYSGVSKEERRRRESERVRAWHVAHPERVKEIKRDWYQRNSEKLNAKARKKYRTPERRAYIRSYAPKHRSENPELYRTYGQNRRARKLFAPGSHTDEQWLSRLAEFDYKCVYCGASGKMCRDHDIPLARGGSNNIDNIVPACGSCNSAKGTLTGEEFRKRRAGDGPSQDPRWKAQLEAARCR